VIQQIAMGGTHAAEGFRRPYSGARFLLDYTRSSASLHSGLNSTAPFGCYRAVTVSHSAPEARRNASLRSTPGFDSGGPCRCFRAVGVLPSAPEARKNTALRSTPGFRSGAPSGCSRAVGVPPSAPEARRNAARSGAQRNSGDRSTKFSNPWQGVAELRRAKAVVK
jgi:hypothetical protein